MKLRIRGNSLRIRVSQSELEQISNAGSAEDAVRFSSDAELRYRVMVRPDGEVGAVFSGNEVQVLVPQPEVYLRSASALGGAHASAIFGRLHWASRGGGSGNAPASSY